VKSLEGGEQEDGQIYEALLGKVVAKVLRRKAFAAAAVVWWWQQRWYLHGAVGLSD
jgi:hypothetical protein